MATMVSAMEEFKISDTNAVIWGNNGVIWVDNGDGRGHGRDVISGSGDGDRERKVSTPVMISN